MSRVQQTILIDLRTSNILISVLPTIDQLILETMQRGTRKKNLHTQKIEMVNAPRCSSSRIRCIQIAHLAFRTCFVNLWTRREKYDRQRRQKIQEGKTSKDSIQAKLFLQKSNCITTICLYRIACAARWSKLSSLAASP